MTILLESPFLVMQKIAFKRHSNVRLMDVKRNDVDCVGEASVKLSKCETNC